MRQIVFAVKKARTRLTERQRVRRAVHWGRIDTTQTTARHVFTVLVRHVFTVPQAPTRM